MQQIAALGGGRLVRGSPAATAHSVSIDTRTLRGGALFVALCGGNHDGHDFLIRAFERGAAGAMVSRVPADLPPDAALIEVEDTLAGLQRLAAGYRAMLAPFVAIGVTGSNGKTSTKDLLSGVISQRFRVNATRGNLNNHIGLPLTVLEADAEDTAGVWEMGMNHFGEIAPLAAIARPDVAVITNIGTAHIEFLGSREGIALEKGRLAEAVAPGGCVVLNADDDMSPAIAKRCRAGVVTAGFSGGAVRAENVSDSAFDLVAHPPLPPHERVRITLPVPGRHMIGNALLAAAVGFFLGLTPSEIKTGLESALLPAGRLERKVVAGLVFLDDSYNANPDSMKAALATLASIPCAGRRIAVLGRMGELGPHAHAGHEAVGRAARDHGIDLLVTVGDDDARLIHEAFANPDRSRRLATHREAGAFLLAAASRDDLILLKGSRSAGMERVLDAVASGC